MSVRIEALKLGRTQFGCDGHHTGRRGDPDCPEWPHHHHDEFCESPTRLECRTAGVPYRKPGQWGRR